MKRILTFLPLVLLIPTLFADLGTDPDRPSAMAGLHPWFFGVVLGADRWQWIAIAVLLALSGPVAQLVKALLNRIFESRYAFLTPLRESDPGKAIQRSASLLVSALFWAIVLPYLYLPARMEEVVKFLVQTAAIFGLVWLAYSIWDSVCEVLTVRAAAMGRQTERLLVPITRKLVQVLILIGGLLLALASYGVNVTGVVASLGVGGLIIALAAKDSVENIFGSLTILFDMPFSIGDWVKIGTVEGSVEEINLRSTRLRTSEDSVITLPNSNLIKASVENLGASRHHRVRTILSVSAQLSSDRLEELVDRFRTIIQKHAKTRKTGFQVEVFELTFTEIHILVNFFINANTYSEELKYRGELLLQFKKAAEEMGIESLSAAAPIEEPSEAVPKTAEQEAAPDPGDGDDLTP